MKGCCMERRSLVLTVFVLAFVAAGAVFYGVGRQIGILPARLVQRGGLLTSSPSPATTGMAAPPALPGTSQLPVMTEAAGVLSSVSPSPSAAGEVAGVQEVVPTAASGGGATLAAAALGAILLGAAGSAITLSVRRRTRRRG